MADDLATLSFKEDLAEALSLEEAQRWTVAQIGPLEITVMLSSVLDPNEKFQARLLWAEYPAAPSLKFRDPATGRLDITTAWPVVRGFRPAQLDACVNWCIEGFALHPEWRTDANLKFNTSGNVVLRILRTLQNEMDRHFTGRFKP